jgi:hypothetical protein
MTWINHRLNPFHKQEEELKKARDQEIKKRRAEGRTDDEIVGCLMCMPETHKFIEEAVKLNPVPGGQSFMRAQLTFKLKEGYIKSVKE